MKRHPQILNKSGAALLLIDIQKKINAVMFAGGHVLDNAVRLIKTCQILQVPVFLTEQYPQGLGPTEERIINAVEDRAPFQKMTFSCCGSNDLMRSLQARNIEQVIISGIESHVCVLQTALDLLANDFQVHVARDAISSRKLLDHDTALERMARSGVVITSTESTMFELLERAGTAEFKAIATLIK